MTIANSPFMTTFAELIDTGLLQIGDGYRAKNNELGSTGPICLRAGHVSDTAINFKGVERFHANLTDRVRPKMAQVGDAVVTTKGNSTGRVTYIHPGLPEFVYSPHLSHWRSVRPDKLAPRFLYYWSRSSEFKAQLRGMSSSTDMAPYLSLQDQKRLKISIPPFGQQTLISEVLGTLDDKIEVNQRINETLEAMALRLFRSWFIGFDPVHAKAALRRQHPNLSNADVSRRALPRLTPEIAALFPDSFEDSTLRTIPAGWSTQALYDIARFLNEAAFKNSDFCDRAVGKPIIKIAELKAGITPQTKYSAKGVEASREIHRGDLLYSWSGSPDTSLETFRWTGPDGLLNQHIFNVITGNRRDEMFAYYQLTDLRDTLIEVARNKQTTGLGHVTVEDMKRLRVVKPTDDILEPFAVTLGAHFDLSFSLEVDSLTEVDPFV